MKTLLYVKANPKADALSRTFSISEKFIEAYRKNNPGDTIVTLDLYNEKIAFLNEKEVAGHAAENDEADIAVKYAKQFAAADRYVFVAPLWNLGIPSILKAYLDYVVMKNISFRYTANGAEGLLKNKKALFITSRGGFYSKPPMSEFEMGNRYLKTIMGFLGIADYTHICAEGLDVIGQDVKKIADEAAAEAVKLATGF